MFAERKINLTRFAGDRGAYHCSSCGHPLFPADKRFDSGTGFPSFWAANEANVLQRQLTTYGRDRIQLVCNRCGAHLGHLFTDARTPSGVRYCVRGESIEPEK